MLLSLALAFASGCLAQVFSRKGRKENGEVVVESKSLYNRFVYFAFFVVKKLESRKGRKERKENGEVVVESKSFYNRFVYFAFFVVKKDWNEEWEMGCRLR